MPATAATAITTAVRRALSLDGTMSRLADVATSVKSRRSEAFTALCVALAHEEARTADGTDGRLGESDCEVLSAGGRCQHDDAGCDRADRPPLTASLRNERERGLAGEQKR